MKNKTIIIILSVLAVLMYTVAVINFCLGNALNGIADVLMASSDALIAYSLYLFGKVERVAITTCKTLTDMLKWLAKGVPATLTVKDGKGTLTLGHDEDDGEIPEEELTDDEKRVKRMAQEYDEVTGRLHRLQAFRDTDTYKQMSENSRFLLDKQCMAMDDYQTYLKRRILIEVNEANLDTDIKDDNTDKVSDHK